MVRRGFPLRPLLLGFAIASMAAGLYAGMARLGVPLPATDALLEVHGPLMICGVFGTLISLERAVAIGLAWPFCAPAGFAVSALLLLSGASGAATFMSLAASMVFLAATAWIAAKQAALFTLVLAAAAAMLVAGCLAWWLGNGVSDIAAWWLGFLVATIAAERLELSRVIRPGRLAQWLFVFSLAVLVAGAALGLNSPPGRVLLGAGLTAMAAWLVRYDVARRTVRLPGQPRYMATAMLAGYAWLGVTGAILSSGWSGPFSYDLALHGVLIGFVLSMVFGHALIILPAIVRVTLRYRPALHLPLAALHMGVALRVAGDMLELEFLRVSSGPLTAVALLGFALTLALSRRRRGG
jgi:hypothetical protein